MSEQAAARDDGRMAEPIPPRNSPILPSVGDVWCWEPLKKHARAWIRVTEVRWNGEEWWIETEAALSDGRRDWNPLSRWVEAAVLWEAADSGLADIRWQQLNDRHYQGSPGDPLLDIP